MRRAAAILFAALFVLLMPVTLFARQAEQRIFSPQAYKTILQESGFYETMPAIVGDILHNSLSPAQACADNLAWCAESGTLPPEVTACLQQALPADDYTALAFDERAPTPREQAALQSCLRQQGFDLQSLNQDAFSQFTSQDWEIFISAIAPPDLWQRMFEASIDQFFLLLAGQNQQVTLSLQALRQGLNSEAAVDALLNVLESKPACTPAEVVLWQRFVNNPRAAPPTLCQLPIVLYPQAKPIMHEYLQAYAQALPPALPLLEIQDDEIPERVFLLRFGLRMAPALPLLFLAIASVLAINTPRDWLRWWGIPTFLAGLNGLLLNNFLLQAINQALLTITQGPETSALPAELVGGLVKAGLTMSQDASGALTRLSLALSAFGGLLLLGQALLPNATKNTTPPG